LAKIKAQQPNSMTASIYDLLNPANQIPASVVASTDSVTIDHSGQILQATVAQVAAEINNPTTQIASATNMSAGTLNGAEFATVSRGSGILQTPISAIAAFTNSGIINATNTNAGALTGAEYATVSRGSGILQTTLTTIANWVINTFTGFTSPWTNGSARTVFGKLSDVVSILDFGAATSLSNNATAINAALSSGALNIYVPEGTFNIAGGGQLTFQTNGQRLFGPGTIVQTNSSFTSGVIVATSLSNIVVEGLTIVAPGNYQASAVMFTDCTSSKVLNCKISNHGYGVYLYSNNGAGNSYFQVSGNVFTSAAPNATYGLSSSTDVYVQGHSEKGIISNNLCNSTGGYGIACEAYTTTDLVKRITIQGNAINGYNSYGIMLYRNGPYVSGTTAAVQYCVITNNTIDNISGSRPRTAGGTDYVFGAGIYIQGAEDTLVANNKISNTNTATTTNTLAPGAIGVGSVGRCIIANNEITNPVQYGVFVTDTFYNGYQPGAIHVDGNLIQGAGVNGVNIVLRSNVLVRNNAIIGAVSHGIATSSNTSNFYCDGLLITNNNIVGCGGSGISLNSSSKTSVRGNKIDGRPVSTAAVTATVSGGVVTGLTITNPGIAGVYSFAPTIFSTNDTGTGFTGTLTVSGGQLATAVVNTGGASYSGPPSIQLVGGVGRGGLQGIDVSFSQDIWVEDNDIVYMASRGIDMESSNNATNNAALNYTVKNNIVKYSSIGYQFDCPVYASGNVSLSQSTSDYAGLCNPYSNTTTLATATSATINVANYRELTLSPATATSFTTLQNGAGGQELTLYAANANVTIVNGASIRLSGSTNFVMNSGSSLTLKCINSIWQEISRCT
jgi:hypothetical protein